ncbi:hypothetical protein V2H45_03125 [Tumidithrix elongata RA019]|uniref:Uncharacterized protein n=1 Tax=Tumidithrix elongata BACA0141 TaxID=2716417 RepID=A0AAW9PWU3_9CYAN|nr:hypothetical protein [Tumidithrix elongata RA019]
MTISLQLEPEIETRLIAQADAQGTSVEELLSRLIEGFLKASATSNTLLQDSPQKKTEQFLRWAKSHSDIQAPILSDYDISRESIYSREDEML